MSRLGLFLAALSVACAGQRPPAPAPPAADASAAEVSVVDSEMAEAVPADASVVSELPIAAPPIIEEPLDTATCTDAYPKGSLEAWRACAVPYGCTLTPRNCCEGCSMQAKCEYFAVSVPNEHLLRAKVCPTPMACPACVTFPNPQLHAACRNAKCEVIDVRTDAISACTKDDDCIARVSHCCDPCKDGQPEVAIRKDAVTQYKQEVCGKQKCMDCPPKTWKAICHPTRKHCVIAATP